jgi:hypothetical protein
MSKPGWLEFLIAVAVACIGFYHALKVKPSQYRRGSVQFTLMNYAHSAGWIAGIGGSLGALRILWLILSRK